MGDCISDREGEVRDFIIGELESRATLSRDQREDVEFVTKLENLMRQEGEDTTEDHR